MATRKGSTVAYGRDPVGREQLILQHLPLVHHVIGRLAVGLPNVLDREDLVAHGVVGLIQAVDRFDPSQGVPFAAWATIRIRGAVIDAIRALDILSPAVRQQVRSLQATTSQLTASLERMPTDEEIQEALGVTGAEYASLLEAASCSVISLDAATETEGSPLADLIQGAAVEDPSERGALLAMIGEGLRRLDERERRVLSLYYVEDLTLQDIAQVIGLHRTVVVRIHGRAILKLRAFLETDDGSSPKPVEETNDSSSDRSTSLSPAHANGLAGVAPSPTSPASLPAADHGPPSGTETPFGDPGVMVPGDPASAGSASPSWGGAGRRHPDPSGAYLRGQRLKLGGYRR